MCIFTEFLDLEVIQDLYCVQLQIGGNGFFRLVMEVYNHQKFKTNAKIITIHSDKFRRLHC